MPENPSEETTSPDQGSHETSPTAGTPSKQYNSISNLLARLKHALSKFRTSTRQDSWILGVLVVVLLLACGLLLKGKPSEWLAVLGIFLSGGGLLTALAGSAFPNQGKRWYYWGLLIGLPGLAVSVTSLC